ncbi:hypothetical protein BC940DRAFT_311136 [Gongronella butleri]|nr:hypothetical protein BC940DRAFT_311136 [Gongronella butleri]
MFFSSEPKFSTKDIPDLTGKTAIITGASNGIGKVSALEMARKGCHCVLACRSEARTRVAIDEIIKETGNDKVEFIHLDLASFKSVNTFADTFLARFDKLDILLNNAAFLSDEGWTETEDGLETMFQINYVATALLTLRLLPLLRKSAPSRIVNVSSDGHKFVTSLNTKDYTDKVKYWKMISYGRTKFALTAFSVELVRRLKKQGVENVYVNCVHPGAVETDMLEKALSGPSKWIQNILRYLMGIITREEGALTQLYVSTSPVIEEKQITGQYYVPIAKLGSSNGGTRNEANGAELWDYTQNLLSEKVPGYTRSSL